MKEAQEPAFLSKLRAQASGRNIDQHDRQVSRPRRVKATDEEDSPTIVDEENRDLQISKLRDRDSVMKLTRTSVVVGEWQWMLIASGRLEVGRAAAD